MVAESGELARAPHKGTFVYHFFSACGGSDMRICRSVAEISYPCHFAGAHIASECHDSQLAVSRLSCDRHIPCHAILEFCCKRQYLSWRHKGALCYIKEEVAT